MQSASSENPFIIVSSPPASVSKLHHGGRVFGLLSEIRPAEDCQIAVIGGRHVALPQALDLSENLGERVGLARLGDQYFLRRLA